jgi:hypothetical protein
MMDLCDVAIEHPAVCLEFSVREDMAQHVVSVNLPTRLHPLVIDTEYDRIRIMSREVPMEVVHDLRGAAHVLRAEIVECQHFRHLVLGELVFEADACRAMMKELQWGHVILTEDLQVVLNAQVLNEGGVLWRIWTHPQVHTRWHWVQQSDRCGCLWCEYRWPYVFYSFYLKSFR